MECTFVAILLGGFVLLLLHQLTKAEDEIHKIRIAKARAALKARGEKR